MWNIKKEAVERENCDTEWLPKCARSNDIKKKTFVSKYMCQVNLCVKNQHIQGKAA